MRWNIQYYGSKVEQEILALPNGLLARYLRLTDLMLEFGPNLGAPHTKPVEKGLFELRIKSKEGIARVFFCTRAGERIVMLHVFIKKTQKTPHKEIVLAKTRMNEVMQNESY